MATTHLDGQGGSITILEHGSATTPMRFRMIMSSDVRPPAPEYHPSQTEDFTVLRGALDLGVIDGKRVVLRAGDTFHLPARTYHHPSNGGEGELEFEAVLTPGLVSADMFADVYAVVREHQGLARASRLALLFERYTTAIQFKPPFGVALQALASVARLAGVAEPAYDARSRPSSPVP